MVFAQQLVEALFPAGAGMNRHGGVTARQLLAVPRRRGDEPRTRQISADDWDCSPQARG